MAWMGVASLDDEVIGGESYTAVGAILTRLGDCSGFGINCRTIQDLKHTTTELMLVNRLPILSVRMLIFTSCKFVSEVHERP